MCSSFDLTVSVARMHLQQRSWVFLELSGFVARLYPTWHCLKPSILSLYFGTNSGVTLRLQEISFGDLAFLALNDKILILSFHQIN